MGPLAAPWGHRRGKVNDGDEGSMKLGLGEFIWGRVFIQFSELGICSLVCQTVLFSLYGFVGRSGLTSKGSRNGCYALLLMMRRILIYRRFSNRAIFGKFFPKSAARATVPGGPSVPCSTAKAVEWDAAWSQNLDLSGCAALGVHVAAYEEDKAEGTRPKKLQAEKTAEGIV
ncbi:PREDICTED: uncharacterized protein LOC106332602 [Brassica oleracea var. oleracea]|uniref:uncharacterized protein LOC106332602 n=1 Tax=Brassica oleracea var. oleracea TaxID=109376 RepID=UPI0006A74A03|nr:PREDICTED: uncharacterized protein LOC106332602 [Brassica oleracea var. oleracea]